MRVRLVDKKDEIAPDGESHFHGCPWCGDPNEVHPMKECLVGGEVLGDLVGEAIENFEWKPEPEAPPIMTATEVQQPEEGVPFPEYVGEPPIVEIEIDSTMVGTVLKRSAQNTTESVWRKCYPGAFWVRGEKRLADPSSKSQCVGDIRPGTTADFRVMIPRFPLGEKPDFLRIAILENGVGWHTVEDIRVR